MNPPNILLIVTDQQRFDTLGAYGCTAIETPNLDRLARDGIRFENAYANNPICTPSRASLWTGKALPGHGVYRLHDILPEGETLFPWHLSRKGYKTALFGKLHVSGRTHEGEFRHKRDGFDVYECAISPYIFTEQYSSYGKWLHERNPSLLRHMQTCTTQSGHIPAEFHFTHWATERAADFIAATKNSKPFFCCVGLFDPHDPYDDHPAELLNRVDEDQMTRKFGRGDLPAKAPRAIRLEQERGALGRVAALTEEQINRIRRSYFASIAFLDQEVGKLLRELDQNQLYDETLIVFLSDHGDMLGEKGLLGKGAYFYDPCTRIPLLIKPPGGIPGGQTSGFLAQPSDIAATLLEAGGYSETWIRKRCPDSRNLLSLNPSDSADGRIAVCCYRNSGINCDKVYWDPPINATMIRNARYKLSLYHNQEDNLQHPAGQLFDMREDPKELQDLWQEPTMKGVRADLLLELNNWFAEQDCRCNMARGGSQFPPSSDWAINTPIRV